MINQYVHLLFKQDVLLVVVIPWKLAQGGHITVERFGKFSAWLPQSLLVIDLRRVFMIYELDFKTLSGA